MMHAKIPKVEREREGGRERETLANACVLLLWRRIIYWPIIWVKALRGVAQILFCFFRSCLPAEHKQCSCCKIKWLVSRERLVPLYFFFSFSPGLFLKGRLLTWYLSFFRGRLEFHFYLSIMHEVAEIRPRSATPLAEGLSLIPLHSLRCTLKTLWHHSVGGPRLSAAYPRWHFYCFKGPALCKIRLSSLF